jgi:hypothetical protein
VQSSKHRAVARQIGGPVAARQRRGASTSIRPITHQSHILNLKLLSVDNVMCKTKTIMNTKIFHLICIIALLPVIVSAQQGSNCEEKFRQLEANKKMVSEFYQQLFGDKNPEVIPKYLMEDYIQHNPSLPDGRDALYNAVKVWFKDTPKEKVDIQRIAADGDLVYLHVRSKMGN